MKKSFRIAALCLTAIMVIGLFAGCGKKNKLVGTWEAVDAGGKPTGDILTLARNGQGSIKDADSGMSGDVKWSVKGNTITMTVSICGMSETTEGTYTVSGKKLTIITDEGASYYIKK